MDIKHVLELFKSKQHSILGIDITSSAVKILEVSGAGDRLRVEGYGYASLPSEALDGHVIKDVDAVAHCIKKLFKNSRMTCKQVALAVPDSLAISKVVQINKGLNDEEFEELVVIEADKYIPYPIDEINLDFEIIGHSAKNPAMLDVLIVASRAENVNCRIEAIARAGLEAKVVDVESYAVERAAQLLTKELPAAGRDKIIAIIDIGTKSTQLFVLYGMRLIFSREESFGDLQLIEAIAEHYEMTLEQAKIAREQNKLPYDYDAKVLEPFKAMVLLQIKRNLQFFYSTSQHRFVDYILLAGGLARQPGLVAFIQERLSVTTTVVNPFANMSMGSRVNLASINSDAPALMVACGLALRHIK